MEMVTVTPINANAVYNLLDSGDSGSVVFHYAVVRGATFGRKMNSIEFKPADSQEDIIKELRGISAEIKKQWEIKDVLMIRAVGKMKTGDIMALVAASAVHREEAFAGCSYGVEKLKQMKSIVKRETFK